MAWVLDGLQLAVLVTLFPFYIRYYIQPDGPAAQANGFPFTPTTFIGELYTPNPFLPNYLILLCPAPVPLAQTA